jgi:hypothetical protein
MKDEAAFHDEARRYYQACIGPDSQLGKLYRAILDAEEIGDYDAVDELRQDTAESILSVEQLTHSFRASCTWEILVTTGGPAARVVVEVNADGEVRWADFQYQEPHQPWYSPEDQDHRMLTDWADVNFPIHCCPYCAEEQGR